MKKEGHKIKLLEYLANPENEFLPRYKLASDVLGIAQNTFYQHFSPNELSAIEAEGLALRRQRYVADLAKVDAALIKKAKTGDVKAIRLIYEHFDNLKDRKEIGLKFNKTSENLIDELFNQNKRALPDENNAQPIDIVPNKLQIG